LTRRLMLLNLILLGLAAAGIWRLRIAWRSETVREAAVTKKPAKPLPPAQMATTAAASPVRPADYIDIAAKDLFTRDRNPTIVVETKAPPPKVMPPLPLFHGVMNLGDGPTAILSEKKGSAHRDFRPGEKIGEFTQIHKRLEELEDRSAPEPAQTAAEQAQAAPPPPPRTPAKAEPGVEVGKGMRACQPGDASPSGTTVDGMRKRTENSPFGQRCWWEAVQ